MISDNTCIIGFFQLKNENTTCCPPGMTEVTRQIQLGNQIEFGSRSFRSIEYELVHNFHSKQFSC